MSTKHDLGFGIDIGGSGIKGPRSTRAEGQAGRGPQIPTLQPSTPEAVAETARQILDEFGWTGLSLGCTFPRRRPARRTRWVPRRTSTPPDRPRRRRVLRGHRAWDAARQRRGRRRGRRGRVRAAGRRLGWCCWRLRHGHRVRPDRGRPISCRTMSSVT
ncbi:hypothetical protein HBB16_11710 [Pseudonocardia sp. MCCB 268]|nr:hypothetical protein [Pseudonocardia cytotoxica]